MRIAVIAIVFLKACVNANPYKTYFSYGYYYYYFDL